MVNWVEEVFRYLPNKMLIPSQVQTDGQGGVVTDTFDKFLSLSKAKVGNKLLDKGVEVPDDWDAITNVLLISSVSQLVAGYILRKFPTFEGLYKEYFAAGFATLDEFIEASGGNSADGSVEFVDDTTVITDAFPSSW